MVFIPKLTQRTTMKIHFGVKNKKALRATVVVKQEMFDFMQEQGFLQQIGDRFWYKAEDERAMWKVVNSLINKQLKANHVS